MFIPLHDHNPLRHVDMPYVTWSLIGITVLCHVLTLSTTLFGGEDAIVVSFGVIPSVVDGMRRLPAIYQIVPSELTLVTYAFLHGDWWHLLGNMAFLFVFGDNVEDAFGHVRFFVFYIASAIFAALIYVLTHPTSGLPLVGASGAVAAIIAAYLMLHPNVKLWVLALGRIPLRIPVWIALGIWVLFQFYNVAVQEDDGVAWWAHVGGLIAGGVLALVMRRPGVPLFDRPLAG